MTNTKPTYYVLDAANPRRMLLFPPPDPSMDDSWVGGHRFKTQPKEPVVVKIRPGHEKNELLPFFGSSRLMTEEFAKALQSAGVDNLDLYDAVIQSKDGSVVHRGYKAFNLIGMVQAAGKGTVFNDPPSTRLIDASIEGLTIDPSKVGDLLMFRLAEFVSAVIVHEKVKRVIEAKQFPHVVFREPENFVS